MSRRSLDQEQTKIDHGNLYVFISDAFDAFDSASGKFKIFCIKCYVFMLCIYLNLQDTWYKLFMQEMHHQISVQYR